MAPRLALGLGSAGKLDDGPLSVGGPIFGTKKNAPGDPNRRKSVTTLWSDFRDHGAIFATPHTVFHSGEDQKTVAVFEQVLKREPKKSAAGPRRFLLCGGPKMVPKTAPKRAPKGAPKIVAKTVVGIERLQNTHQSPLAWRPAGSPQCLMTTPQN